MATCHDCGDDVIWCRLPGGRTAPPMEIKNPSAQVVVDGALRQGMLVERHICDPEKVAAWQHLKDERRDAQNDASLDLEALLVQAWEYARIQSCRKCGAEINQRCRNLTEARKGVVVETRWPHLERRTDPQARRARGEE